jgi:ABC-type bacteriocin/lantibiotic exporter with double-glycine peptidase domain
MRMNVEVGYCGLATVVNVLRVFGVRVSWRNLRSLTGTTAAGTDEQGIVYALRNYGCSVDTAHNDKVGLAWSWLIGNLTTGRPVILCCDNVSHWLAAIGLIGERIILFDSTRTQANVLECGVHVLSRRQLLRRWSARDGEHRFYGIAVGR